MGATNTGTQKCVEEGALPRTPLVSLLTLQCSPDLARSEGPIRDGGKEEMNRPHIGFILAQMAVDTGYGL